MGTPRLKIFARVTPPLVKPAVLQHGAAGFLQRDGPLSGSALPEPDDPCTKYVQMGEKRAGEASILAVIMILFGVADSDCQPETTSGRQSYTTVTGKSGQISLVNLGKGRTAAWSRLSSA